MKKLSPYFLIVLFCIQAVICIAQTETFDPERLISKDSLLHDLRDIESILSEGHTGLNNYSSAVEINASFEQARSKIIKDMTEREFTAIVAEVIGQIKCGHTFVRLSEENIKWYKNEVGNFPLELKFIENRAYVIYNFTPDSTIKKGMEIIAVNGKPISKIIEDIFPLIPADGGNEGWKSYQLGKNFDYYYRLKYGNVRGYSMEMKDGDNSQLYTINPMTKEALNRVKKERYGATYNVLPVYFKLLNDEKTGYLRVKSFSNEEVARYKQSFHSYLRGAFKELRKKKTKNLILDLRGNVGGRTDNVIELARYLKQKSFRPYEKITIKKNKPLSYVNYDRRLQNFTYGNTIKRKDEYHWQNRLYISEYRPHKKRFKGNLFVLIDGSVFSGGSHLCALIHGRNKTLFIGEKTGGGGKFSNAGVMTTITLKRSGIRLTVPMFKGVYSTTSPNKLAVFPDKKKIPSHQGILNDKDEVIEFTFELINSIP